MHEGAVADPGLPRGLNVNYVKSYYYRLQRSWAKVIFSQACVILFTAESTWQVPPPSRADTGADTPWQTRPTR